MQVIPQHSPVYLWPLADKMTEPRLNQGGYRWPADRLRQRVLVVWTAESPTGATWAASMRTTARSSITTLATPHGRTVSWFAGSCRM
jgi:hypothetical protein